MNSKTQINSRHPFVGPLAQTLTADSSIQQIANPKRVANHACFTDQPCILERLRREKQRAQRSGFALSVLLVTQYHINGHNPIAISGLLKAIRLKTRETDFAGYIDQRSLGVVLPYTDKEGASKIREKLIADCRDPQISITTSTYPDQLLDSLTKNGCVSPDALKLMVEDTIQNSRVKDGIKKGIDIIGSIVALLILSPLLLVTTGVVKYSSSGAIIFSQYCVGHKENRLRFINSVLCIWIRTAKYTGPIS